ncbi:serine/threonine protein phosphatase [Pseudorhodobacter sp. E13]|uniref:serine/threonine protein phosphatase n=1 Tax=Pseudorhodobacter sp. E13 TaxID=2487931 RepID=UPI000F8C68CF|nr:serine/threonine protein phosphatase [Pseudorhodobacter sp. E13]RUS58659.1 serine/threonine protein phosphatase [Pseudorhodobacter sp. E13]
MTGDKAALEAAIQAALAGPYHRIQALPLPDGRKVWLKRAERLTGRMRLQKGSGAKGFAREWEGLRLLGEVGLPAAPILAAGPDWFVTPDLGPTLRSLLWDGDAGRDLAPIFAAAGGALARLHLASYRHGRPAIRDLCWDGHAVHFIDLERFSPVKSDPRGLALDLMVFVHSLMADGLQVPADRAEQVQEAAIAAYRGLAPGIWAQARVTAGWLRWLPPLARLSGSREWRALAPTLARFRQDRG